MNESNQQASSRDKDLSWLAAALESEGWFIFHVSDRRKNGKYVEINPTVGICNTDWTFIQTCNEISRKWITGCHIKDTRRKRNPKHQPCYYLIWGGMKRSQSIIGAVLPYMRSIVKTNKAKLLKEFIDIRLSRPRPGKFKPFSTREIALLIELKRLNNPTRPITKGTLEKLQRLKTEQYLRDTDDIVQATEM